MKVGEQVQNVWGLQWYHPPKGKGRQRFWRTDGEDSELFWGSSLHDKDTAPRETRRKEEGQVEGRVQTTEAEEGHGTHEPRAVNFRSTVSPCSCVVLLGGLGGPGQTEQEVRG